MEWYWCGFRWEEEEKGHTHRDVCKKWGRWGGAILMEWEGKSCMKHALRAKGQCRTKQPAWSWKVKHKYSSGARKWDAVIPDSMTGWQAWKSKHNTSYLSLWPHFFGEGCIRVWERSRVRGGVGGFKKGRLNPVETWLTEEPQCCSLTGSPRLAAASVCKANDASWGSHICFPPWPHVLWVNAAPPWLNTGNPITNEVLLGLLCIHPQKLIDERVIMHAHRVGVCRLVCSPL